MAFVKITEWSGLSEGMPKTFFIQGRRIALVKRGEECLAFEDVCTHDDGPLAEGPLVGDVIECPRHGAKFNVRTGAVLCMPAATPIQAYAVKREGAAIWVDLEVSMAPLRSVTVKEAGQMPDDPANRHA